MRASCHVATDGLLGSFGGANRFSLTKGPLLLPRGNLREKCRRNNYLSSTRMLFRLLMIGPAKRFGEGELPRGNSSAGRGSRAAINEEGMGR